MKNKPQAKRMRSVAAILLWLLFSASATIAQIQVTGTVTSKTDNTPMPGVNVVVKGTTVGTTTNVDGAFSLNVSDANATLVFSFIGFKTLEVPLEGRKTILVSLEEETKELEEIVVIGYGSRAKKDVTTAISSISSDDIREINAVTPELAMQGRMAGVQVVSGGATPTARPTIRIRGMNTWQVSSPLYVIDGVPITEFGSGAEGSDPRNQDLRSPINIMTFINPEDIESISVLKDASAAAIYGVRASNGVILISTKRGKTAQARVEFSMKSGYQNIPKKYDVLSVPDYVALYREAYANVPEATDQMPKVFDPNDPSYLGNRPTTDWQTPFLNKNAPTQDYNLQISGAKESFNYFLGAGYNYTESPYINNNIRRYSVTSNLDGRLSKYFTTGLNLRTSYSKSYDNQGWGGGRGNLDALAGTTPWQPIYDPDGPGGYAPAMSLAWTPDFVANKLWGPATNMNPYGLMWNSDQDYLLLRNMGTGYLQFEPLPGLRFKGTISADWYANLRRSFTGIKEAYFNITPSDPLALAADGVDDTKGSYGERQVRNFNLVKEFSVLYTKSFGNHNFDFIFNAMDQSYRVDYTDASTEYLTNAGKDYRGVGGPQEYVNGFTGYDKGALQGYMGRLSYNYNSKYYLDATVRRDGTSKFAKETRWGTFPSFSAAWRISAESFMQNLTWLNDLKIRAGWGQLGNQETQAFPYLSKINRNAKYSLGSTVGFGNPEGIMNIGFYFPDFPNKDLKWETTTTTNFALDGILFGGLDVTIEYYHKFTDGILQETPIAPSVGSFNNPVINIAQVKNSGLEIALNYRGNIGDLQYSVFGNLTTNHNEVVKMYDHIPMGGESGRIEEGYPINYLWGYKMGGIFQDDQEVADYQSKVTDIIASNQHPGDIWFKDLRGGPDENHRFYTPGPDSTLNEYDRVYLGSTLPGFFYGFGVNLAYKGFDFSANFQGVGDIQQINGPKWHLTGMQSNGLNQLTDVLDRWTPTNKSTKMPRAAATDPGANTRFSDRWVENASYLRFAYLEFGYTVPKKFFDMIKVAQGLRIYVGGSNLFTITKWTGLDPENEYYPIPRVLNFGLRATF